MTLVEPHPMGVLESPAFTGKLHVNGVPVKDLQERCALALVALTANRCWLCPTVERGPLEYVAAYAISPYGPSAIIAESFHADPWECLRLGLAWLDRGER